MAKFIEATGNTIAEAIQSGLNQLDLTLEEVTTETISFPKNGFFGFGATKAKVRLTVKEEEIPHKETVAKPVSEAPKTPKAPKAPREQKPRTPKAPREQKVHHGDEIKTQKAPKPRVKFEEEINLVEVEYKVELDETETKVKVFVDGLLEKMGIVGEAKIISNDSDDINVNILGDSMGNVIGRRGDTLDAIQYITNLVAKNSAEGAKRVRIDCENYRVKREQTLEKLALKMGHKVLKYKKNMTLEPMNPYERRVIHEVLQNFRGVFTYSTGKEPNRRVVIGYGEKTEK